MPSQYHTVATRRLPDRWRVSALLSEYAGQIARLSPSSRNPERFHEDKSEIVAGLLKLAKEVGHG
ncbi:hypothetical protein [Brucella pituitosa]|uniref:Uncharacterized protein n=1 Tax=Brucella pituitosa TaxID=571256 RepID=A0ABS3JVV9_9HYPH|nr:hypothetical protein [Brucella pituitosa]MBO1038195.1 hypothetical protein [Brucella pituitosa]